MTTVSSVPMMKDLKIGKKSTSSAAGKFAVNVHEVGKVFCFLILWRVSSLLWWVHHFCVCKFYN